MPRNYRLRTKAEKKAENFGWRMKQELQRISSKEAKKRKSNRGEKREKKGKKKGK